MASGYWVLMLLSMPGCRTRCSCSWPYHEPQSTSRQQVLESALLQRAHVFERNELVHGCQLQHAQPVMKSSYDASRVVTCGLSKLYFSSATWCARPPIVEEVLIHTGYGRHLLGVAKLPS
ncbi:hypothetical protein BJY52DRAFT_1248612 [Lactarius psammicola]|nr:hypothetical protein BJY52DRAFT_1248612 [Lactarius psammicola]